MRRRIKKANICLYMAITKFTPPDGQQQGERVTPKREELHEDGGIQGEGGMPMGADENLEEQADDGQTEALGGLVASVKQLQVSELIVPGLAKLTSPYRRSSGPRKPWWPSRSWTPPSSTCLATSRRPTTGRSRGRPPWRSTNSPPNRASGGKGRQ